MNDASSTDIKKENSFNLSLNNINFPLQVEVYPYREGSKVVYTAPLSYTISSTGEVTLAKDDIDSIAILVNKIIND